jgi:hypothetical protein
MKVSQIPERFSHKGIEAGPFLTMPTIHADLSTSASQR